MRVEERPPSETRDGMSRGSILDKQMVLSFWFLDGANGWIDGREKMDGRTDKWMALEIFPEFTAEDTRGIDSDTIWLSTNEGLAIATAVAASERVFTGFRKQNANEKWKKGKNTPVCEGERTKNE